MTRIMRSPPASAAAANNDDDDDDDYGNDYDEYDESFESFNSKTRSPTKVSSLAAVKTNTDDNIRVANVTADGNNENEDDDGNDNENNTNTDDNDGSNSSFDADMDLETFMVRHVKKEDNDSNPDNTAANSNDPSMRPLDGLNPQPNDDNQQILSKRLGHEDGLIADGKRNESIRYNDSISNANSSNCNTTTDSKGTKVKKSVRLSVQSDDDYDATDEDIGDVNELFTSSTHHQSKCNSISSIKSLIKTPPDVNELRRMIKAAPAHTSSNKYNAHNSDANDEINVKRIIDVEKENAAKVDALLSSLNISKGKDKLAALSSISTATAKAANKNKVKYLSQTDNYNNISDTSTASSAATMLSTINKHPKSNRNASKVYGLGASHIDNQDSFEVAKKQYNSQEHHIASLKKDLKMRDDRLARVTEHGILLTSHVEELKAQVNDLSIRLKQSETENELKEQRIDAAVKLKKKLQKKAARLAIENDDFQKVKAAFVRLQEREQALLEAVNELSSQNEDLISKLKLSMQRELELNSMASSKSQMNDSTMSNGGRAQSDSMIQREGGRKKGKKEKFIRIEELNGDDIDASSYADANNSRSVGSGKSVKLPELY